MSRRAGRDRPRRLIRALLRLAAREALLIAVCLAAWAFLPVLAGATATTVMTDSMSPGIRAGDVVVARPVPPTGLRPGGAHLGNVLLVDDPDRPGRLRLHRWVGTSGNALVLRGDANPSDDGSVVQPARVRAVAFLRVPFAGLPVLWARTGRGGPLALSAAALFVVVAIAFPSRRDRRMRLHPLISRTAGAGTVLLAVLAAGAVAHQPSSWAVFNQVAATTKSSFLSDAFDCFTKTYPNVPAASFRYSYSAGVGPIESDTSGNKVDGRVTYWSPMRQNTTCAGNPYITTDLSSQYVYQTAAVQAPASFTVSEWFRTTTAGGKLAGFGNTSAGYSTTYDRHVYMSSTGLLSFGVQTDAGRTTCTSTSTYADGNWHLFVASYSAGALTLWTDDGTVACTATAAGTISAYTGYWQFGNDTLDKTLWPNTSKQSNYRGDLDETAVYPAGFSLADERAVYAAGR